MKYFVVLLLTLVTGICKAQKLVLKQDVSRRPYTQYRIVSASNDTISCYLSKYDSTEQLPLIVYIQGSSTGSLFSKDANGLIQPRYGHIGITETAKGKVRVLIVDKPGIQNFQQQPSIEFDRQYSLTSWTDYIKTAIRYIIKNERIDTTRMMLIGHSEGGVVAAKLAHDLGSLITHTAIWAGEGTTQLYSLYHFATTQSFADQAGNNLLKDSATLITEWKKIMADPLSTQKKFWGLTYLRWSSFLQTSVYDELSHYNGNIMIAQGNADRNVSPESAKILYTGLLSKNKNVSLKLIPDADHSFMNTKTGESYWRQVAADCIQWFMQ